MKYIKKFIAPYLSKLNKSGFYQKKMIVGLLVLIFYALLFLGSSLVFSS